MTTTNRFDRPRRADTETPEPRRVPAVTGRPQPTLGDLERERAQRARNLEHVRAIQAKYFPKRAS